MNKPKTTAQQPIKAATLILNPAILEVVLVGYTDSLTNHEIADALLELQKLAGFGRNHLDLVLDRAISRLRLCATPRKVKPAKAKLDTENLTAFNNL